MIAAQVVIDSGKACVEQNVMKQAVGPNDLVYQLPVQNYGYIEYNDQGVY